VSDFPDVSGNSPPVRYGPPPPPNSPEFNLETGAVKVSDATYDHLEKEDLLSELSLATKESDGEEAYNATGIPTGHTPSFS
jgi:hypothetical protein